MTCLQCAAPPLPGRARCRRCTEWVRDWHARRRAARIAAGRCVACGQPAAPDARRCRGCLAKAATTAQAYRDRKNPGRRRKANPLDDYDAVL